MDTTATHTISGLIEVAIDERLVGAIAEEIRERCGGIPTSAAQIDDCLADIIHMAREAAEEQVVRVAPPKRNACPGCYAPCTNCVHRNAADARRRSRKAATSRAA